MSLTWTLGGTQVDVVEEVRLWDELELSLRVQSSQMSSLRSLLESSGKVSVVEFASGRIEAVDRLNSGAAFTGSADGRSSVRPTDTWFVTDYEEEILTTDGSLFGIDVVLVPDVNKSPDTKYSTSPSNSESDNSQLWYFEFSEGDVLTGRVTADFTSSPSTQLQTFSLQMVLRPIEVRVLEESCGALAAVSVKSVPDGPNFVTNVSEFNEVFISPPDNATGTIPSDDYVVTRWETVFNGASYIVSMEVVPR